MLESMGAPLPGETLLIATGLYCATTHKLNIVWVIVVAIAGAIMGDNVGYLIGRSLGSRALARWGQYIGLTKERLTLGRYLFHQHGGMVVFFGRFIAILRTFAALLAGANRMPWHSFLIFNALGSIGWAGGYSLAAYELGSEVERFSGPLGIAFGIAAITVIGSAFLFLKRNEKRLVAEAMQAAKAEQGTIEIGRGGASRS
ncbi:DedA family protein (plasmid) [Lichenicola cladoniae]|uniref:DedA family protein n=1 Tax=Lichenicola cladoniae TaxID=1484109 RepID=A0A6M8HZ41_9PROT|nr:DedA family protein [Lichenicola cladoniae]NPD66819.1 DedA family protein [Acetobacteraceae bacterium]QKE93487.1 DedA family protein [Lichenicola cladoniae]